MQNGNGLISVRSKYDVAETARRFREAAERASLIIFSDIDHGQKRRRGRPCPWPNAIADLR
jgi:uncharacterized protein (DUF302 family)